MKPTPEEMIADLATAGWVREASTRWRSPSGDLFLGPYRAWMVSRLDGPSSAEIDSVLAGIEIEAITNPATVEKEKE